MAIIETRLSKLIALRSALRLEIDGSKCKGSSVAGICREFLGIEQRISNEQLLTLLTEQIEKEAK